MELQRTPRLNGVPHKLCYLLGWPARSKMGPSTLIDRLNGESRILAETLFARFPEWLGFAKVCDPVDPRDSDPGSLYLRVSSPHPGSGQYLGIHHRGNTFELFYSDGEPPGPAEAQFIFTPQNVHDVAAATVDLLTEIVEERVVHGRSRPPRLRWLFGGSNQQHLIRREELTEKRKRGLASITSWRGTLDEIIAPSGR